MLKQGPHFFSTTVESLHRRHEWDVLGEEPAQMLETKYRPTVHIINTEPNEEFGVKFCREVSIGLSVSIGTREQLIAEFTRGLDWMIAASAPVSRIPAFGTEGPDGELRLPPVYGFTTLLHQQAAKCTPADVPVAIGGNHG